MEDELSVDDPESVKAAYDSYKFDQWLELSKQFLLKLDDAERMKVLRLLLKNPNFDGTDVCGLCMFELQESSEKEQIGVTTSSAYISADVGHGQRLSREQWLNQQPFDGSCGTTSSHNHSFEAKVPAEKKFQNPIICRFKLPDKSIIADEGERLSGYYSINKQPFNESSVTTASRDRIFETVEKKFEKRIIWRFKLPHKPITVDEGEILFRDKSLNKKPSNKSSVTSASCDHIFEGVEKKFEKPIICRFKLPSKHITVENKTLQKYGKVGPKQPHGDGLYCDDENIDLPINFKESIQSLNGSQAVLVIQKRLYRSDTGENHSRFFMPMRQIRNEFLRPEEKALLSVGTGKKRAKIKARVIAAKGKKQKIYMTKWDTGKTSSYNLVEGWNRVVERNKLREGMVVQLWSFRVGSKLWFALVKV